MVWVVWTRFSDGSGTPEFLGWTGNSDKAEAVKNLIDRTCPGKTVEVDQVPELDTILGMTDR